MNQATVTGVGVGEIRKCNCPDGLGNLVTSNLASHKVQGEGEMDYGELIFGPVRWSNPTTPQIPTTVISHPEIQNPEFRIHSQWFLAGIWKSLES